MVSLGLDQMSTDITPGPSVTSAISRCVMATPCQNGQASTQPATPQDSVGHALPQLSWLVLRPQSLYWFVFVPGELHVLHSLFCGAIICVFVFSCCSWKNGQGCSKADLEGILQAWLQNYTLHSWPPEPLASASLKQACCSPRSRTTYYSKDST